MNYKINKNEKRIKVFGEKFIKNNKGKRKFLINDKKYVIIENFKYGKY